MQWSDEIPTQVIHAEGKFKVRINWWTIITSRIHAALTFVGINDIKLKTDCEKFLTKYAGSNHWQNGTKLTTKEEVDEANAIITRVIEYLQNNL